MLPRFCKLIPAFRIDLPVNVLPTPLLPLLVFCIAGLGGWSSAGLLYETDFEGFTPGPDQWVGTEGWEGDSIGFGVHGIDLDAIPGGGLGNTAFIGLAEPEATLVSVSKPFNYAPGPADDPVVIVDTMVGIEDSFEKPQRDSFFISILNSSNDFLAAIHFANQPTSYGIWREDGVLVHDTGFPFFRGELHHLYLTIDLAANRWSAEMDGAPLFDNEVFTASAAPINFGKLAYEWQLTAQNPAGHGDNWMLVADTIVRTAQPKPVSLVDFLCESGVPTVSWVAERGCDYQVEYSSDLSQWFDDLDGSFFPGITTNQILSFSDDSCQGLLYYRVRKSYTP